MMDYQDNLLATRNRQKLEELTEEVHKIEDFLESEFNSFAAIVNSKPRVTAPDRK